MNKLFRWNVAALLSAAAMQTMAAGVPTDNNTLLMSGATAVDRTLAEAWLDSVDGLCDPAFTKAADDAAPPQNLRADVYFVGAIPAGPPVTSPANFLIRCTVKAGVTGIAGTLVGYGKFSGGSETGIQPVAALTATATPGVTVTYPNPAACTTDAEWTGGGYVDVHAHGNCGPGITAGTPPYGQAANPRAGIADVEPKLFGLSATGLTVESAVAVTFSPVVSRNFYAALQATEGLTVGCTDLTATTANCVPSLTLAQIRGLYAQKITGADLAGVAAQATAPVAGVGNTQFRICRRANTSGTQKSFENFFFGQGCRTSGSQSFAVDPTPLNPSNSQPCSEVGCTFNDAQIGATGVFQGTGSGDVEACLDDAVA
ncbi:MAG TPA: hypothetical protein VKB34_11230, partial [Povalibacter sp.]|nr:hypothetical protein [Povalibacter sp.]